MRGGRHETQEEEETRDDNLAERSQDSRQKDYVGGRSNGVCVDTLQPILGVSMATDYEKAIMDAATPKSGITVKQVEVSRRWVIEGEIRHRKELVKAIQKQIKELEASL